MAVGLPGSERGASNSKLPPVALFFNSSHAHRTRPRAPGTADRFYLDRGVAT